MKLIHPKCIGEKCGTWELCLNTNVLKYGCVHYDDETMEMEIERELEEEDNNDSGLKL